MPLEPHLDLEALEAVAGLHGANARLGASLRPHVRLAFGRACRRVEADALARRAGATLCASKRRAGVTARIFRMVELFDGDRDAGKPFPRSTAASIGKMHRSLFGVDVLRAEEEKLVRLWGQTDWPAEVREPGPAATSWQTAHRFAGLLEIGPGLAVIGAILFRASLVHVHGGVIPFSVAMAWGPSVGPEGLSALDVIDRCHREMTRLNRVYEPEHVEACLQKKAVAECRQDRVAPVIRALCERPLLPRGKVPTLARASDRTARRDIHLLMETGWITSDTEKGPLRLSIPPCAARDLLCKTRKTAS